MEKHIIIVFFPVLLIGCSVSDKQSFDCANFDNDLYCRISNLIISDSIDGCTELSEPELCSAYFGVKYRDYSICDGTNENIKKMCYLGIMVETVDFETCYQYPYAYQSIQVLPSAHPPTKDQIIGSCTRILIDDNMHKEGLCDNLPDIQFLNMSVSEYCISYLDETVNSAVVNMGDCVSARGKSDDICVYEYSVYSVDSNECDQIGNENLRNSCLFKVAMATNNISLCPKNDMHPGCVSRIVNRDNE